MIGFSDIVKQAGLSPEHVLLFRHPLSNKDVKLYYEKGMVREYTAHQGNKFKNGHYTHWAVFMGDQGTLATFYACYEVQGVTADTVDRISPEEPHPEWFQGENQYFTLVHCDLLREYEQKLVIDWGNSTRMWHQKGTNPKPVWSIEPEHKEDFPGFENLILSYSELKNIVDNPTIYSNWVTALSSVNAIYLIVDCRSGKQYVGSAYGNDGLWGRWSAYVTTLHGGDKHLIELLCQHPERYQHFQFSILQILPKTVTDEQVIAIESLYKKKLLSIRFGMNAN